MPSFPFHPRSNSRPARIAVIADFALNHDGSADRAVGLVVSASASGADGIALACPGPAHLRLDEEDLLDVREEALDADLFFVGRVDNAEGLAMVGAVNPDLLLLGPSVAGRAPLVESARELGVPFAAAADASDGAPLATAAEGGAAVLLHAADERRPKLRAIGDLADRYDRPVGVLDGSTSVVTGAVAVAAGAVLLVKRFTELRTDEGPTHAASLDPVHFTHYADLARDAAKMMG